MQLNPAIPGRLTRLAEGPVSAPRLSGDGTVAVWSEWGEDNWDLMRWQDGHVEAIGKGPAHDLDPSVSEDGKTIVWTRLHPDGNSDVMQWKEGQVTYVAASPANENQARVSADGSTVVWVHDDVTSPSGFDLRQCRDGQTTAVTQGWEVDLEPTVNRDGSWLYFRRKVDFDGGDLWMRDPQGQLKQVTHSRIQEFGPTTSADGKTLVWSQEERGDQNLYRFTTESTEIVPIAQDQGVDERDASLSADGQTVAYTRGEQVMLYEGGQATPLTLSGSNGWPQVSSDGQSVAFWSYADGGRPELYLFERQGSEGR